MVEMIMIILRAPFYDFFTVTGYKRLLLIVAVTPLPASYEGKHSIFTTTVPHST